MPFVHIELLAGRSPEQLEKMMKDVTRVISEDTGAPKEHISVIVSELGKNPLAQGGQWTTPQEESQPTKLGAKDRKTISRPTGPNPPSI